MSNRENINFIDESPTKRKKDIATEKKNGTTIYFRFLMVQFVKKIKVKHY